MSCAAQTKSPVSTFIAFYHIWYTLNRVFCNQIWIKIPQTIVVCVFFLSISLFIYQSPFTAFQTHWNWVSRAKSWSKGSKEVRIYKQQEADIMDSATLLWKPQSLNAKAISSLQSCIVVTVKSSLPIMLYMYIQSVGQLLLLFKGIKLGPMYVCRIYTVHFLEGILHPVILTHCTSMLTTPPRGHRNMQSIQ